jgi:hypothetical protein
MGGGEISDETLPTTVVDALDSMSSAELRRVAVYANRLADERERSSTNSQDVGGRDGGDGAQGEESEASDDDGRTAEEAGPTTGPDETPERPDSVPAKATTVVKEINDNRYYYWQWRDGDQVKSKYMKPVSSSAED